MRLRPLARELRACRENIAACVWGCASPPHGSVDHMTTVIERGHRGVQRVKRLAARFKDGPVAPSNRNDDPQSWIRIRAAV